MSIISKTVQIKVASNYKYYQNLGYKIPMKENGSADFGKTIEVNVSDLPPRSPILIEVQCDCCGTRKIMKHNDYQVRIEQHGNFYCKNCWQIRLSESLMKKYGVTNNMAIPGIREELSQTKKNQSPEQKKEILQKKIATSRKHFGTDFPLQSQEIQNKMMSTMRERYNVDYGMQSPEIQKRARQGMIDKYGAPYSSQVPEIRQKIAETAYKNQTVHTSNQQIYISNLYHGKLNAVVSQYNVDILLEDDKIVCEFDGKGHDLRITLGHCTKEEFEEHEIVRDKLIKKQGYKIMRIISHTDKLPSDLILLQMLSDARTFFSTNPDRSWCTFDIDNGLFINNLNKDHGGEPYDFGQLRTIKKEEIIMPQIEAA